MKVHYKIKEVLKEFKWSKMTNNKMKFIVSDDAIHIYEVKDIDGNIHTIKIISDIPMFRNTVIKDLLYKTPIYFSHHYGNEKLFEFRLNDYTNENELVKLN